MVYISTSIMGLVVGVFMILAFSPSLVVTLISAAVFGVGYGSYQAVDWALALDVLPPNANIAKDLGIWHITFVLPQVISPLISGLILDAMKPHSLKLGYILVFATAFLYLVGATVFIYPVKLGHRVLN